MGFFGGLYNQPVTGANTAGFSGKASCRVATTANLSGTYANGTSGVGATLTNNSTQAALTIDGVAVAQGDRVLVKNQSTTLQNGIYTVTNIGSGSTNWVLTRATDYDQSTEIVEGSYAVIEEGTAGAGTMFVMNVNGAITVGTTGITFLGITVGNYTGSTSITTVGTLTAGTWNATKISEVYGGTNQSTYATGDMLYASASNTLSKLSGNTTTTKQYLSSTGTGSAGQAPAWAQVSLSDLSNGTLVQAGNSSTADGTGTTIFSGGASPSAGNFYGISIQKSGTEEFLIGINKSTATGNVPGSAVYLSNYLTTGKGALGRGNGAGQPSKMDLGWDGNGNVFLGTPSLATNATNGFVNVPSGAGSPSGTPTTTSGYVPIYYDTTNHKWWVYDGAWKGVVVS